MSTLVWVRVPAESFVLDQTLSRVPDLQAEIQPTILSPSDPDTSRRLVWTSCEDFEALERAIHSDDSLRAVELVESFEDRAEWLFQVEWGAEAASLPLLTAEGGTILAAYSRSTSWDVRMFFFDRQTLSEAYEACRDRDIKIRVTQVQEASESDQINGSDLTVKQYEALVVANQQGYYDIPRRASAETVADVLDISHQALSERLSRGHRNLIKSLLQYEDSGTGSDPVGERLRFDST
jgi:predicted DNA binding protein